MGMVTLLVTVTLDKQPKSPQRQSQDRAATPEFDHSEVYPGQGLITVGSSITCLPACTQLAELTLCLPSATLQRFLGGSVPLTPVRVRFRVLLSTGQSAHKRCGMMAREINTESSSHVLLIAIGQNNVMLDECNPVNNSVCV